MEQAYMDCQYSVSYRDREVVDDMYHITARTLPEIL